ncbi:MAG TPA: TetR/AcrR family transcriptional regulator [Acidimicrobiales bacterium]|nr:TetR/AcrR family transcriptional regulator [Acidimicrobiales bacterium]
MSQRRPLTRQESQARTRSRLVRSAERVFLKQGYLAASIGQIARTAGYTTGAVYSNFTSKEDLGLAVIQRHMVKGIVAMQEQLDAAEPTVTARLAALGQWVDDQLGDEEWVVLVTEFALSTRHKPAMRAQSSQGLMAARMAISGILDGQSRELGVPLPMSSDRLAAAILGLGIGVSVLRIADPSTDSRTFGEATGILLAQLSAGVNGTH